MQSGAEAMDDRASLRTERRGKWALTSWQIAVSLTFETLSEQVRSWGWSSLSRNAID